MIERTLSTTGSDSVWPMLAWPRCNPASAERDRQAAGANISLGEVCGAGKGGVEQSLGDGRTGWRNPALPSM